MGRKPPKSKFSRLARLGGLSSRVSGSYMGQRVKGIFQDPEQRTAALNKLHLANAERVVETMGALKGAAMKLGQTLAVAVDGFDVPPDVSRILGKLHDSAEPIPFEDIRRMIESELEAPLEELFATFDPVPIGAASLAQAHAATLKDGTEVVIKTLYEGIESSVDSDINALKTMLITGRVLRRDPAEINAVFEEIRERLLEELDYYQEAANLEWFRNAFKDVEGISIPKTYPEFCTKRVLTMDRIPGKSADKFIIDATPEARQRAGTLLVKSMYTMIYRLRTLHADPHGGNYLFQPDGSIGIIDFGCVKRFDLYWIADYGKMTLGFVNNDSVLALDSAEKVGILGKRDPETERVLWEFGRIIGEPLMVEEYTCGTSEDPLTNKIAQYVPTVLRQTEIRSPPDIVMLHRSLHGIYTMLRKLNHTYKYGQLFRDHAQHAIDVAEGRITDTIST
jgi:predicted unusual protein kinase regulating ubiquinone biosynthesis (AarF/ABC1/UbiB family)